MDAFIARHRAKFLVAADDDVCAGCERAGEKLVVVRIIADCTWQRGIRNDRGVLGDERHDGLYINIGITLVEPLAYPYILLDDIR